MWEVGATLGRCFSCQRVIKVFFQLSSPSDSSLSLHPLSTSNFSCFKIPWDPWKFESGSLRTREKMWNSVSFRILSFLRLTIASEFWRLYPHTCPGICWSAISCPEPWLFGILLWSKEVWSLGDVLIGIPKSLASLSAVMHLPFPCSFDMGWQHNFRLSLHLFTAIGLNCMWQMWILLRGSKFVPSISSWYVLDLEYFPSVCGSCFGISRSMILATATMTNQEFATTMTTRDPGWPEKNMDYIRITSFPQCSNDRIHACRTGEN